MADADQSPNPNPNPNPKRSSPSQKKPCSPPSSAPPNPNPNPNPSSSSLSGSPNPNKPRSKPNPNPNSNPKLSSFALSIPAPPPAAIASSSPSPSSSSPAYIYHRPPPQPQQYLPSPSPSSSSFAAAQGGSPQFFSKAAMAAAAAEEGRSKAGEKQARKKSSRDLKHSNSDGGRGTAMAAAEAEAGAGSGAGEELQKKKKKKTEKKTEEGIAMAAKEAKAGQQSSAETAAMAMAMAEARSGADRVRASLRAMAQMTELNPSDAWLPIAAVVSRSSRSSATLLCSAAFHSLSAAMGFQALLLPVAIFCLGWYWGIIALVVAFIWQLYTMWILIRLHESNPGVRYCRYVQLSQAAFGDRLGFWLATPPSVNLTVGTSTTLIIIGGSTLKLFYKAVCGPQCGDSPLSTIEWYLVFALLAMVLTQLPNFNSIVGLSLLGVISTVSYCVLLWVLSITRTRPSEVSYGAEVGHSYVGSIFTILNALGIIAFCFRGHINVMEIQATMPSSLKHPAHLPMWRGAKVANTIIALCFFPVAIGGYWAYGRMMLPSGILASVYSFHEGDISRAVMALLFVLVVMNCLAGFQTSAFAIFDSFEAGYEAKRGRPIGKAGRAVFRILYVLTNLLIGVAFPWLSGIAGLLGGITCAPITFAYPCFMWLAVKKPKPYSFSWYLNWSLGLLAISMSAAFAAGGVWSIVTAGLTLHFFRSSSS